MGERCASDGLQMAIISNTMRAGGYGLRLTRLNEFLVQPNDIDGTGAGVVIDENINVLYLVDNLIVNCTSHGIRCFSAEEDVFIALNRLLSNNSAGAFHSPEHVQADGIGAHDISAAAKDLWPYPMLRCGVLTDLDGNFTDNNMTIAWSVPIYSGFEGAASHVIHSGYSVNSITHIAAVTGTVMTYTDHGLGAGTYYYPISALNAWRRGQEWSAEPSRTAP